MKRSVFITLTLIVGLTLGSVTTQFLDLVSLRCLDKILGKKAMKESELKEVSTEVAEEILQTLEFLENEYFYQVAVVLGGQGTNGYGKIEQNHTHKIPPSKDVVHYKYYPMGFFSAYTFIYAGFKKYFYLFFAEYDQNRNATNCTAGCALIPAKVKDVAAKIAERELFGKESFKKNVTRKMMLETITDAGIRTNGTYSYAFEYLITDSKVPINFATTHNFKDKNTGLVSILAKGSINTVFATVFGYQYHFA